ncbi:NADP-dependent oxidoreductase domain-containing protein [Dipodascopsis uninucleata]
MPVDVILGTAGFGKHGKITTVDIAEEFLEAFKNSGYNVVDTAFIYPGGFQGESELFLGELGAAKRGFLIDTKVRSFAASSHTANAIFESVEIQFKRLRVKKVRTLYLHCPDRATPYEQTHKAMDSLHKMGRFEKFGLSNFTANEVELFVTNAKENNWVAPSVYQGLYNIVSRRCELELFPILKKYDINFFAYSPLAVGFFSNVRRGEEPKVGGRFDSTTTSGQRLQERYFKESLFDAVERIEHIGAKYNISNNSIALRWLKHHSLLSDGDAIIIGASNLQQVSENLASLSEGELPTEIVDVVNDVWKNIKNDSPAYSR